MYIHVGALFLFVVMSVLVLVAALVSDLASAFGSVLESVLIHGILASWFKIVSPSLTNSRALVIWKAIRT